MIKFNPYTPETESRLLSGPIRENFNVLNDRTDQLTVSASSPVTTSVIVGKGDKVYFEDNVFVPFSGITLELGSSTAGIGKFTNPNKYKEIIIYYKHTSGVGEIAFIESTEKDSPVQSVETAASLINDPNLQYYVDSNGTSTLVDPDNSPLVGSIILCSVLVSNNGTPSQRGAINPIFESDIIDLRPFLHRTMDAQSLLDHKNAATLDEAHPGATINNNQINIVSTAILQLNSTPITTTTLTINKNSAFDPLTEGNGTSISISPTSQPSRGTSLQVANILSYSEGVDTATIVLDRNVTIQDGYYIVRGTISADKIGFDLLKEFKDSGLLTRNSSSGKIVFQKGSSSAPSINFDGYSGSGFYVDGSNKIGASTNGVSRLVVGTTNISSSLPIDAALSSNQLTLGTTNKTTINAVAPSSSRTYTLSDVSADAYFILSEGTQTINGSKTFSNITLPATVNFISNGSLIKSGNFNLTLTSSAATNATFPVGNITLADLESTQIFTGNKTFSGTTTLPSSGVGFTSNGSLIKSGNFNLTLTSSAITNATFPAGTITLADLESTQTSTGNKTFTGQLYANGTLMLKTRTQALSNSTNYILNNNDSVVFFTGTSITGATITLPTSPITNALYVLKSLNTVNNITITNAIDGGTINTTTIAPKGFLRVIYDGSAWYSI